VLREQQQARREREQLRIRMMNADPFDLEAQRLIAKVKWDYSKMLKRSIFLQSINAPLIL
jgi:hypothetical protein